MDTIDRIFELLEASGLSQQNFASLIGVKKNAITKWKTRESKSYAKYLTQIAEILKTTTDYLLNGTEQDKQATTPEGSGLSEEFAKLFMQLTPENQNKIIAEMLRRLRGE
ncbi:MAG: helix-turn-helix domain-containing protein [Oscillibacter sp.]|nr:helix-turn-helix domain-containing protein [Oscillibacter sp.]